jgi:hypothetical protein
MIKGLQFRKTSQLKDLVDKIPWWDTQGLLFAKGHCLVALMDDLDQYKRSGKHSIAATAVYLKRCSSLNADFESWHEILLENSPCPIHWTPYRQESGKEDHLVFASLYLAHLMLDYWALRLMLTTSIDLVCSQVPQEVPSSVRDVVDHLQKEHGQDRQLELAKNIMSSMPYCMSPVGLSLLFYYLRMLWNLSLESYRHFDSPLC